MGETYALELKDISKRFGSVQANDHVNLTLRKSEILAILGENGSGKTTLISLIPRFYDATEGEVLVDGVNVKNYKFDTLYDKLGYVTQKAVLFAGSIRENVFFGESAAPKNDEELKNAIELSQAEEFVDKLPDGAEHMISQMGRNVSGGQKQRCACARAIINHPKLILADEPTGALDSHSSQMLLSTIQEMNEQMDATILMVTHDAFSASYCNRILFIKDGQVFNELHRGTDTRKEFFTKILEVVSVLGGEQSEHM